MNFDSLAGELSSTVLAVLIFAFLWFKHGKSAPAAASKEKCVGIAELKLWLITEVRDPILRELEK